MGNLEKLGILVIVILVVVVGVVAITPKEQVDTALFAPEDTPGLNSAPEPLDQPGSPLPGSDSLGAGTPSSSDPRDWPLGMDSGKASDMPAPGAVRGVSDPKGPGGVPGDGKGTIGAAGPLERSSPPAPAQPTEYVVVKGDTGVGIARKLFGTASAWDEIVALNPGLDARRMKNGQKLKIPAARTPAASANPAPLGGRLPSATQPSGSGGSGEVTPPVGQMVPAPAAEKIYVVQAGDTLSDIARRELGSASRWRLILDANAAVLHGSEVVRSGMKLTIPALAKSVSIPGSVPSNAGTSGATAGAAKSYTVQSGDTLTSIASRMLGTGSRWREIQKANEAVLHGSDRIVPGMELSIPQGVSAK